MKTKIISLVIAVVIVVAYGYFKFNVIWTGERIQMRELGTFELSSGTPDHDFFEDKDWLIITGEEQRLNWNDSGYNLPEVDFKETFIVLSNQRLKALYKEKGCDVCTGVPNGFAVYDYFNSDNGTYYIYAISSVWISQGVG